MITWIKRKKSDKFQVRDVSFRLFQVRKGSQRYAVRIAIAPDIIKLISKTGYIAIGHDPDTNHVFFRDGNSSNGYKILSNGKGKEVRFTPDDIEYWKRYEGSHDIKYDRIYDMYYIEV